jgi:hypothetical protein
MRLCNGFWVRRPKLGDRHHVAALCEPCSFRFLHTHKNNNYSLAEFCLALEALPVRFGIATVRIAASARPSIHRKADAQAAWRANPHHLYSFLLLGLTPQLDRYTTRHDHVRIHAAEHRYGRD